MAAIVRQIHPLADPWSAIQMLSTELLPGVILHDAYRIERKLAEGGMGCVYEARHIHLERRYALKQTFFPDAEPALREGFRREAALLANLEHPSLPKVYHFFSEHHNQYIVMDFVEGNSLKQILQTRHSLPPWQVLMIALGVLDVLLYLHEQSPAIVHRDIKPDNIKVHRGRVYLLDFGLAKDMLRGTQVRGYTKGYSSPEQEMGESTDARSDIYSLGATLHHILDAASHPNWRAASRCPCSHPCWNRTGPPRYAPRSRRMDRAL